MHSIMHARITTDAADQRGTDISLINRQRTDQHRLNCLNFVSAFYFLSYIVKLYKPATITQNLKICVLILVSVACLYWVLG
jgi:hypothetical protein